jgi:hypothetical protein
MSQKLINKPITRRRFVQSVLALGVTAPVAGVLFSQFSQARASEIWLSAQGRDDEHFSLGWVDPNAQQSHGALSGFRGHGMCQNPTKPEEIMMFSRRPGTLAVRVNTLSGEVDHVFHSEPNHHMHGHGCYSADGTQLFYTESDYVTGEGKVTVRDANTLAFKGCFSSYGIGPHEMALMPDDKTLVVANGGLRTHPDSGRTVLNYESMRSTLAYINSENGQLISEHVLAEPKASIRHLDVASDGTVAIALQVQRAAMSDDHLVPLAAVHKDGHDIEVLNAPTGLISKLNDYMGSVKVHSQNRLAAFTSPKGNMVMFWHLDDLSLQGYHLFHDVCGLTLSADERYFVLSNSAGKIRQISSDTLKEDKAKRLYFADKSWDNHMMTVTLPV